ncbi:MAG: aldo/keto reductase [SAR324 cluster bacterium]|nr:aldo/keto reductase [SAR324 cluster bacterium]
MSTRTLFGAAALWTCGQDEADRVLELLLQHGINHIDTAPRYGDAELRIGAWMKHHRKEFFLATKTRERTYKEAKEQIHQSLERLRVDQVDLLQLHSLSDPEQWEVAMGPGGALKAAIEAREQGLVRFIGVTGHGLNIPSMHMRSLERFEFDSVLMPYNYAMMQNSQYRVDFEAVVKICQERNVAVQTIKSIARGQWGDKGKTRETWYEPLEDQASIDRAVHYVFSREGMFLNTVGDTILLQKVLDAASRFQEGPSAAELDADIAAQGINPLFTDDFSGP